MKYVIQAPNGEYLHPDNYRLKYRADHGAVKIDGAFWTKDISQALTFEKWSDAEARAGILFWGLHSRDITFKYMDTIKEVTE